MLWLSLVLQRLACINTQCSVTERNCGAEMVRKAPSSERERQKDREGSSYLAHRAVRGAVPEVGLSQVLRPTPRERTSFPSLT